MYQISGQLYVAMSRVQSPDNLTIFKIDKEGSHVDFMKNVVFQEILS